MPRSSLFVRALVAAWTTAIAGVLLVLPSTATAAPTDDEPLALHMRSISPDYVPAQGPIVVRGTVENVSDDTWTAVKIYAFISSTPMTTSAELTAATATATTAYVGDRIIEPGTFYSIDVLRPGQSTSFEVRVPRADLPVTAPGVYWFGVHALGANDAGRPGTAVGRDRTFLPLVADAAKPVDTALVVPVRAATTRAADGSVDDPDGWASSVESGPLAAAVAVGRAAAGRPLTWLVDPAVPDTVRRLAAGNPARSLGVPLDSVGNSSPTSPPSSSASSSASSSSSSSADPSADPGSASSGTSSGTLVEGRPPAPLSPDDARTAERGWLRRLHRLLRLGNSQILGLPYGDVVVDSASYYDRPLLTAAIRRTGRRLAPWGLHLTSAVAPPAGGLAASVIRRLPAATRVLLGDLAATGSASGDDDSTGSSDGFDAGALEAPGVVSVAQHTVLLSSTGAASGGPGPRAPRSPLALRQRILSEAALRANGAGQPLVVQLPSGWRPGASFFPGLDTPWLTLTTVDRAVADTTPTALADDRLQARSEAASSALGPTLFAVASRAAATGSTLSTLLATRNTLARDVFAEAVSGVSYSAQSDPAAALGRLQSTQGWISARLGSVHIQAPQSVTLASTRGHFSVLVSNDLDVPVSVKVRAFSDRRISISGGDALVLPPHGQRPVLLNASTHALGVHTVTLALTDSRGTSVGTADEFPMRAEQVSRLIWVIMGAGIGLLFAAIVVRLIRRLVRSRA